MSLFRVCICMHTLVVFVNAGFRWVSKVTFIIAELRKEHKQRIVGYLVTMCVCVCVCVCVQTYVCTKTHRLYQGATVSMMSFC